jgi:hypothetical protein
MDLDNFQADYRAFKARVMPMVLDYEAHKARDGQDREISADLNAEINAPLSLAEDATDEQKAAYQEAVEAHEANVKLAAAVAHQSDMSDEEKAALDAEIHAPLPPADPDDPTRRPIVKPDAPKAAVVAAEQPAAI